MKSFKIKGADKPMTKLVLGTTSINEWEIQKSLRLLDEAVDNGFWTLDTARAYPSESTIGRWMQTRANRSNIFLISKGGHPDQIRSRVTPADILHDLNESLRQLQTDHIDLYMLHRDDTSIPVEILVMALNEHISSGKVGAIGASNWSSSRIAAANAFAAENGLVGFSISSPHFSLAEQFAEPWAPGCISISGESNRRSRDWYAQAQMPVLAYSSLSNGFLSGRLTRESFQADPKSASEPCRIAYCHEPNFKRLDRTFQLAQDLGVSVPQLAIAYILNSEMNVFPIVGAQNAMEMQDNLKALDIRLTPGQMAWLNLESDQV